MPNWIAISLTDIADANVIGKVDALRDEAQARGMSDPFPRITKKVVDLLRACIGFSGRYQVDSDTTTIPASLLELATMKIVRDAAKSIGLALSDDEKADEKTFESRINLIRQGEWPIEAADTPIAPNTVPSGSGFYGSDTPLEM